MNIVNKAILSFVLLLIYLSNYLLLLNNKNKLIIRNALTVAAFTILTIIDIIYFDMSNKYFYELFSAQLLMVFFMEDAVISVLSKKLFFNESIKMMLTFCPSQWIPFFSMHTAMMERSALFSRGWGIAIVS